MTFDILWQLIVPCTVGGTVRTIRYFVTTKKEDITLFDSVKEFASGAITGFIGVQAFNPEGTPREIFTISAFTGISGIAWIMSRSDISPAKEKQIMDANIQLDEIEKKPTTDEALDEAKKQLEENVGKK